MVTEQQGETNRPYAPPSNVIAVLQRLRSRNLPDRVDVEYLRDSQISEGTIGRTLFGLRFLGLITEEDLPTQALRSIHTSTDEEYQTTLAGLIRDAYVEVFNVVNPAEETQGSIENVFRRYTPASQRKRMVVFFLGLCREAGIATLDVPRQRGIQRRQATEKPIGKASLRKVQIAGEQPAATGQIISTMHPSLEGLVSGLPPVGEPLSDERLDEWVAIFKLTLRFLYPKEGKAPESKPEAETEVAKG